MTLHHVKPLTNTPFCQFSFVEPSTASDRSDGFVSWKLTLDSKTCRWQFTMRRMTFCCFWNDRAPLLTQHSRFIFMDQSTNEDSFRIYTCFIIPCKPDNIDSTAIFSFLSNTFASAWFWAWLLQHQGLHHLGTLHHAAILTDAEWIL